MITVDTSHVGGGNGSRFKSLGIQVWALAIAVISFVVGVLLYRYKVEMDDKNYKQIGDAENLVKQVGDPVGDSSLLVLK